MKIMTRINALGETKFYLIDQNWDQYEYDYKEYRRMMKARKLEKLAMMIAAIERGEMEKSPKKDLF